MDSLLLPAYQKFYSAISSLERLNTENNFFDNISSIDTFFSEYRNITFVIQKSLKNTDYFEIYEKNRDCYLTDHWFVDKRNETTKQQPFQLVKRIEITIYSPHNGTKALCQDFTIEDNVPFNELTNDMKEVFKRTNPLEVYFSAKYTFFETGTETDIWSKFDSGLDAMRDFMDAMYRDIGIECSICNQLREKINKKIQSLQMQGLRLVDDYIYYPQQDTFERGNVFLGLIGNEKDRTIRRAPLKGFMDLDFFNFDGTPFGKFTLMHAFILHSNPKTDLMPTFMIVYKDGTYDMIMFHSTIKTTVYRTINEVADIIRTDDVEEVFWVTTYLLFENTPHVLSMPSKDRQIIEHKEILACMKVDRELNEMEYSFETDKLYDTDYINHCLHHKSHNHLEIGKTNLMPIINAFKARNNNQ